MAQQRAVKVEGLRELQRDFRRMSKDLDRRLTGELKQASAPVAGVAQQLALGRITNVGRSPRWAGMRVGVSRARGSVFIAPSARRRAGSGRPNFAQLLAQRAMEPAVDEKQDEVVRKLEQMLDDIANRNGF